MPTSPRLAPAIRNCSAIVVLPDHGLPSSRCSRLRANPPPSTKSIPSTPVLARGKRVAFESIGLTRSFSLRDMRAHAIALADGGSAPVIAELREQTHDRAAG